MSTTDVIIIVTFIIFIIVILFMGSASLFSGGARLRERRYIDAPGVNRWMSYGEYQTFIKHRRPIKKPWKDYKERFWGPIDKFKWIEHHEGEPPIIMDIYDYYARYGTREGWHYYPSLTSEELVYHQRQQQPTPISKEELRRRFRTTTLKGEDLFHGSYGIHKKLPTMTKEKSITTKELASLMKVDAKEEDFIFSYNLSEAWKLTCRHIDNIRMVAETEGEDRFALPDIVFYPFSEPQLTVCWEYWIKYEESNPVLIGDVIILFEKDYFLSSIGSFISQTIQLDTFMEHERQNAYVINIEIRPKRFGATVYRLHSDRATLASRRSEKRSIVQIDDPVSLGIESLLFILLDGGIPPAILTGYPNYGGPFDQLPRELRIKLLDDYKRMMDKLTPGECAVLFLNNKTVQHETPEPLFQEILRMNKNYNVRFPDAERAKGLTRYMFVTDISRLDLDSRTVETPIDLRLTPAAMQKISEKRDDPIRKVIGSRPRLSRPEDLRDLRYRNEDMVQYNDERWQIQRTIVVPDNSYVYYNLVNTQRKNFWVTDSQLR